MKNKKGFSMVELLAAIVILGVLMTVSIGSIKLYLDSSRKDFYNDQRKSLVTAARLYYQAHNEELPKTVGTQKVITLEELETSKYIGKIYDKNKEECISTDTKVIVTKVSKDKYEYKGYLYCQDENARDTAPTSANQSDDFNYTLNTIELAKKYSVTISKKSGADSDLTIKNYEYSVVKNGYAEKKEGEVITGKKTSVTTKPFTIDDDSNLKQNNYTIVVKVVDSKHRVHTKNLGLSLGDAINPTCVNGSRTSSPFAISENKFVKEKQSITLPCTDKDDQGIVRECQKDIYKVAFNKDVDTNNLWKINVKDLMGNGTDCDLSDIIKIDSTAPTIDTKGFKWKNNDTEPTETDISTITQKYGSYQFGTWSNLNIYLATDVKDDHPKELNAATKAKVKTSGIDFITYTTTGRTKNYTDEKVEGKKIKDQPEERVVTKVVKAEGKSTIQYKSQDNSYPNPDVEEKKKEKDRDTKGNKATGKKVEIWIDKTKPKAPTVTIYKWKNNNTKPTGATSTKYTSGWSKLKLIAIPSSKDVEPSKGVEISGIDHYEYTTTGTTTNASNVTASYRNIEANGISTIKFRAVDKAGNISDWSDTYTVKIDHSAPKCTTEKSHLNTTDGVTAKFTCTDQPTNVDNSGMKSCTSKKTELKSDKSYDIEDNAGNTSKCTVNVTSYKEYKYIKKNVADTCTSSCCGTKTETKSYSNVCSEKANCPSGYTKHKTKVISNGSLSCPGSEWYTCSRTVNKTCTKASCCGYKCGSDWTDWGASKTGCKSKYRLKYK